MYYHDPQTRLTWLRRSHQVLGFHTIPGESGDFPLFPVERPSSPNDYKPRQTPCIDRTYDPGSGFRPNHPLIPQLASFGPRPRGHRGRTCLERGYGGDVGSTRRLPNQCCHHGRFAIGRFVNVGQMEFGVDSRTLYQLVGWPMYLLWNASGQSHYPKMTNHFRPSSVIFAPHQHNQIVISDVGVLLWIGALVYWSITRGFLEMARIYGVPYLWVNHWLVLITFLQHTDPYLPHYRGSAFNFQRGALSTLDRSLLAGAGPFFGWLGGVLTHGISETHVLHHVSSKIPHYNAWEASDALRKRLAAAGVNLQGAPGGWTAVIHAIRTCKVCIEFHLQHKFELIAILPSSSKMRVMWYSTRMRMAVLPARLFILRVSYPIRVSTSIPSNRSSWSTRDGANDLGGQSFRPIRYISWFRLV